MEKIKLVIWDLDDTFWQGTLAEEGIIPVTDHINIVKELTNRGILNSICSKNDFAKTRDKLTELGIWDYFVFPHIDWVPKGQMVKSIIEKFQLRAANTLFIDDNHINIEEVKYYNPGLHAEYPAFIPSILSHPAFKGKNDPEHERLNDYKLLEKKDSLKKDFVSNDEFLQQSNIEVGIINDLHKLTDRVYEIIERTNQLNYTKKRISRDEVSQLLVNDEYLNFCVSAKDRYGNYGIVGFVSLNKAENRLEHFAFSCRTLNIGIEQYVYAKLKFPELMVVGEVTTALSNDFTPDWIQENKEVYEEAPASTNYQITLLYKGGCDLAQVFSSLQELNINLREESNYVSNTNFPINTDHSIGIMQGLTLPEAVKNELEASIPFLGKDYFSTRLFEADNDVIVYSALMDYTQDVYVNKKDKNIRLTYGGYTDNFSDPSQHEKIIKWSKAKGIKNLTHDFLKKFADDYTTTGQISKDEFISNLKTIKSRIPNNALFIIVNGAETEPEKPNEEINVALERHKEMNRLTDQFIMENPDVKLLDVRKFVGSHRDLTNSIRHYKPHVYRNLAQELKKIIADNYQVTDKPEQPLTAALLLLKIRKTLYKIKRAVIKKLHL